MIPQYKHTQVGYISLGGIILGIVIVLWARLSQGPNLITNIVLVILLAAGVMFASLTIEIKNDFLIWRFGPGPIRKRVKIAEIEMVEPVKNSKFYGWGIRLTPHGWLYNVSGTAAVQVQLKSGKKFRLGTDEPERLSEAIEEAMRLVI